jgi:hypothetical protein
MGSTAPNYGSATNTITYRPATVTGATAHSMAIEVTEANRSTAIVRVLEPTPAPGTLTISYMVQGQWYEISDDGTGKLVGADSSYGSGNLTFVTGSILATIPLPDIGSVIILTWGEADSARTATGLPTRAKALIALAKLPQAGTLAISYPVGAATRNVTVAANGTVTGPAQVGTVKRNDDTGRYEFEFSPDEIPTGPVTCNYTASNEELGFTNDGGGVYTLDQPPLASSVRFTLVGASGTDAKAYKAHTIGTDVYIGTTLIGQINNITGVMTLNGASTISVTTHVETKVQSGNIVEVI